ncbi:MAG TPA: type II toxin-antitoxin system VapB family antitoxin [Candidatus Baltobacteraceae bacterium]|nr:type II toxin-antitoxin system VapB family antitoxin [Candidatus Baltobacteraceae bacterium]
MAFSVKDAETDRLVRELARETGETLTDAIQTAVRERLSHVRAVRRPRLADDIARIARRCGRRPVRDDRTTEEILGYDEGGLPT